MQSERAWSLSLANRCRRPWPSWFAESSRSIDLSIGTDEHEATGSPTPAHRPVSDLRIRSRKTSSNPLLVPPTSHGVITVAHTSASRYFRACEVPHVTATNQASNDSALPVRAFVLWRCVMPTTWWEELREVLWLASVVGGLSTLGVMLAVAAVMIGDWQHAVAYVGGI